MSRRSLPISKSVYVVVPWVSVLLSLTTYDVCLEIQAVDQVFNNIAAFLCSLNFRYLIPTSRHCMKNLPHIFTGVFL